jgi:hypothetical protein
LIFFPDMTRSMDSVQTLPLKPAAWRDEAIERRLVTGLRALELGWSGDLPPGARACADRTGALWLQAISAMGLRSFAAARPEPAIDGATLDEVRRRLDAPLDAPAGSGLRDGAELDEDAIRSARDRLSELSQSLAALPELVHSIENQLDARPPACLITPASGALVIAITTRPAMPVRLQALLPLTLLPSEPVELCELLDHALLLNDLRLLGTELQLVSTPAVDALLLLASIGGARLDAPGLTTLMGRMLTARESLLPILVPVSEAAPRATGTECPLNLHLHALRG